MQQLADVTADLMEENTTSTQASEMLEAESAERMRLEKELKDLQVGLMQTSIAVLWGTQIHSNNSNKKGGRGVGEALVA